MKNTNRYIALALCCTLTLGVFVYRPPKAQAIAGVDDAVVIGALLSAFAGGCGLIFSNNGMTSSELAQGLTDKWNEFKAAVLETDTTFAGWLGYEDMDALLQAIVLSGGNALTVPRLVARKFADFTTWLTSNTGVTAGGDSVPVSTVESVKFYQMHYDSSLGYLLDGEIPFALSSYTSSSVYSLGTPVFNIYDLPSTRDESLIFGFSGTSWAKAYLDASGNFWSYASASSGEWSLIRSSSVSKFVDGKVYVAPYVNGKIKYGLFVEYWDTVDGFKVKRFSGIDMAFTGAGAESSFSRLSVFAPSYYKNPTIDLPAEGEEAANPTLSGVGDGSATSIEELLQKILEQLQANTLAPTLDVAGTQTGGNTGTDEDAKPYLPYIPQIFEKIKELPGTLSNIWETVKGIPAAIAEKIGAFFTTLWGWLQNIIDAIMALPAAIAEKIKALFVPHEGYAAEFVADITATYQGRMGLLTYPFTVLADFVGTVATLEEQEPVLRWDAVEWQNKTIIAAGEYNLKSAVSSAQMQTVYMIYKTVASGMFVVAFLHLCYKKLKEVQRN
ncbi:MAG: hypothetical protein HPZ92_00215 [Oscillospiraceae bacterium]|nr:hypothetical protein [Oscillospiraceae bacterium]